MSDPIVIVSAARTPMGSFQGDFSSLAAHDLGGAAIKAAVERAGISPELVTEVLFGNCLMAGQGQAPARQAAFKGGLPKSAGAMPARSMAALMAAPPRSCAASAEKSPWKLPIGVRAALTITIASVISVLSSQHIKKIFSRRHLAA